MIEDGPEDIASRLRGVIVIPVNDGAGLLDGKDTFTRDFGDQGLLQNRAADMIDQLIAGNALPWGEVNAICMELQEPADPLGIGKTYVVPIRNKASWMIHDLRQKLES